METKNNEKNPEQSKNQFSPSEKKVPAYLIALLITLSVITAALVVWYFIDHKHDNELKEAKKYLELEQKRLENQLSEMSIAYDSLKTENDSMNILIEVEQKKINKLLKVQAANWKKIELYKKELGTLREVMRSYIIQIDSLNTKNKELTDENIKVRQELMLAENTNTELTKAKERLTEKVQIASQLQAKNITALPQNSRGNDKYKIDKIDKIKVCFTVRENAIATPGNKDIYLRIIRPDDIVLASSADNSFESNGDLILYSAKRTLNYENQDIDMCIFWDKEEELIPGTYSVELYSEGSTIGITSFALK